jgi:hypothetical protein
MKYIFTILVLLSTNLFAQNYVAQWTSSLHTNYEVQQSSDGINWKTIGNVRGEILEKTYQYIIPGPGYFYRVKADSQQSKVIFLEPIILSVQIISAYIKGNILTWTVGVEDNVDHYLIESSTDGINFKEINQVKATGSKKYKTSL